MVESENRRGMQYLREMVTTITKWDKRRMIEKYSGNWVKAGAKKMGFLDHLQN